VKARHLTLAQRVIVVVGLGLALYAVANWVASIGSHPLTGWTAFAPLGQTVAMPYEGGFHPWVRLVIFLVFLLVWVGCSLAVLNGSSAGNGER